MFEIIINWLVENQTVLWLLLAILCLFLEISSPGLFFFLSFFFGALIAAIATFVTKSWILQSVFFLLATIVAFLMLRHWIKKRSKSFDANSQTNVYAIFSKRGQVIEKIVPGKMGLVKIDGETWSARSLQEREIAEGAIVNVVRVKGAHIVVEEVKDK